MRTGPAVAVSEIVENAHKHNKQNGNTHTHRLHARRQQHGARTTEAEAVVRHLNVGFEGVAHRIERQVVLVLAERVLQHKPGWSQSNAIGIGTEAVSTTRVGKPTEPPTSISNATSLIPKNEAHSADACGGGRAAGRHAIAATWRDERRVRSSTCDREALQRRCRGGECGEDGSGE